LTMYPRGRGTGSSGDPDPSMLPVFSPSKDGDFVFTEYRRSGRLTPRPAARVSSRVQAHRHIGGAFVVAYALLGLFRAEASGQVNSIIEVRVTSLADGMPVVGATVSIAAEGLSATTDGLGRAVLRGPAPEQYTLSVTAMGYLPHSTPVRARNGRSVRVDVALDLDPIPLREVEVSVAATALPLGAIAVSLDSVGPAQTSLGDVIERIPGVTAVRRGGPGAPTTLQIRGSSADQVLVLLDGAPINDAISGVADLSSVDVASIEEVVVLTGAAASRYGPRAIGGVVLLRSRSADGGSAAASLGVGSWGSREAAASLSLGHDNGVSASAAGQWAKSDGDFMYTVPEFRGGGTAPRLNAASERVGGQFRLTHRSALATSLSLTASAIERGSPGAIAQPSLTGRQSHRRVVAAVEVTTTGTTRGVSTRFGGQWQNSEYRDSTPPFGQAYEQTTHIRQPSMQVQGWYGAGPLDLRAGGEVRRLAAQSASLAADELLWTEAGAWTQVEATLLANEHSQLRALVGMRLDRHDLVDGWIGSPGLSLAFTWRDTEVEAGMRNAFSPPSIADLFFQEGVLVRPNPDLGPERIRGETNVSLRQTFSVGPTRLSIEGAAYKADIDDMILWFPDFQFVWSPGNFNIKRRGFELGSDVTVPLGGATHGASIRWAESTVEYDEETLSGQVAYRPKRTIDADLRVDLRVVSLTAQANHVGERRSIAGSDLNSLPPYSVLDLGVSIPFHLTGEGRLDIVLSNALDESAALLADYPIPGRGWSLRVRFAPPLL
jgi:outer membrane cobalamin receptor